MLSVKCRNSSCKSPVSKNDDKYKCPSCGCDEFDDQFRQTVESTREELEFSIVEIGQNHMLEDYGSVLELCKNTLQSTELIFHDINYLIVQVLDKAMDAAINSELWKEALEYGMRSLEAYSTYCNQYHPALGIQMFRIGKLKILLNDLVSGVEFLEKARSTLEVTHGITHDLVLQLKEILFQTIQDISQTAPKGKAVKN